MIYSENTLGSFEFNYYPKIFFNLIQNFQEVKIILNRTFGLNFEIQTLEQIVQVDQTPSKRAKSIFIKEP
jgi:hypothetical protein